MADSAHGVTSSVQEVLGTSPEAPKAKLCHGTWGGGLSEAAEPVLSAGISQMLNHRRYRLSASGVAPVVTKIRERLYAASLAKPTSCSLLILYVGFRRDLYLNTGLQSLLIVA